MSDRRAERMAAAAAGARARARASLRRGAERSGGRITRGLGEPALFAITLSAVVASIFFALGVVAGNALGLTPAVYLLAGVFFMVTVATYVEGSSLHPERGGASTFARYAFDELWSFIAGWAIILDYIIVMAAGAVVITDYLAVYWSGLDDGLLEVVVAGLALLLVALLNVRGLHADRLGSVLRISLVSIFVLLLVSIVGFIDFFDAGAILDSVELGEAPPWEDAIFAFGVACIALIGVEASSGLAGEVRVGRRGLRRFVFICTLVAGMLVLVVSCAGLMAQPVVDGATPLGGRFEEAPVLGIVNAYDTEALREAGRYLVGTVAALMLIVAMNGQMLGLARLAYSLATNRQIPSAAGRLSMRHGTPYMAIAIATVIAFGLAIPHDLEFLAGVFAFGAMITFALAHLSVLVLRFREPDRPSAFRIPMSVKVRGGRVPLPAVFGLALAVAVWISVIVLHEGARVIGGIWMVAGVLMYVIYRRSQGRSLGRRFTIPAEALQEREEPEYGSILVPVFGEPLDDDIIGTAGRLATEHADEGEGGAVLEALYVFEIPMSLPIDARVVGRARRARAARARARQGGGRGVRGRGGGHRHGARAHRGAGDRLRGPAARGGGDRARRGGAHARARRSDPRRPRPVARPLRRGDHALRGGEGALQGDPDRSARGRGGNPRGRSPLSEPM